MWQVIGMDRYFWFCYQTGKQPPRNVELFFWFSHDCTLKQCFGPFWWKICSILCWKKWIEITKKSWKWLYWSIDVVGKSKDIQNWLVHPPLITPSSGLGPTSLHTHTFTPLSNRVKSILKNTKAGTCYQMYVIHCNIATGKSSFSVLQ